MDDGHRILVGAAAARGDFRKKFDVLIFKDVDRALHIRNDHRDAVDANMINGRGIRRFRVERCYPL